MSIHSNFEINGSKPEKIETWNGSTLNLLFKAGTFEIQRNIKRLNSIDVFPVPVASAGTRIHLTLLSGCREIKMQPTTTAGEVAQMFATGAMIGKRGHQGIPFADWFRGFARAVRNQTEIDKNTFTNALAEAADTTFRGYVRPINGEMWTVAKDIAKIAKQEVEKTPNLYSMLQLIVDEGYSSVARTIDLLPVLHQAGVVHVGGLALLDFFIGMKDFLDGKITVNLLT